MILNLLYGGFGLGGSEAAGGGAAESASGQMVLADVLGALFFNAADSGNHVATGLFVIGAAQTPVVTARHMALASPDGGLFFVGETDKQYAANGVFVGS